MKSVPQLTAELAVAQSQLQTANERIQSLEGQLAKVPQLETQLNEAKNLLQQTVAAQKEEEVALQKLDSQLREALGQKSAAESRAAEDQRQLQQFVQDRKGLEAELAAAKNFIAEVTELLSGVEAKDVVMVLREYLVAVRSLANDKRLGLPAAMRPAELPAKVYEAVAAAINKLDAALNEAAWGQKLNGEVQAFAKKMGSDKYRGQNGLEALAFVTQFLAGLGKVLDIPSDTVSFGRLQWAAEDAVHNLAQTRRLSGQFGYTLVEFLAKAQEALVEKRPILNKQIVLCSVCGAANIYPTDKCWSCAAVLELGTIDVRVEYGRAAVERDPVGMTDLVFCPVCKANYFVDRGAVREKREWHVGADNKTTHRVVEIIGLPAPQDQPAVFVRWLGADETQEDKFDCLVKCVCGMDIRTHSSWVPQGRIRHDDHWFQGILGLPPPPPAPPPPATALRPAVPSGSVVKDETVGGEKRKKQPLFRLPGSRRD